jgi:hypothetical protein
MVEGKWIKIDKNGEKRRAEKNWEKWIEMAKWRNGEMENGGMEKWRMEEKKWITNQEFVVEMISAKCTFGKEASISSPISGMPLPA